MEVVVEAAVAMVGKRVKEGLSSSRTDSTVKSTRGELPHRSSCD